MGKSLSSSALTQRELLDAWESGARQPAAFKTLPLLVAAGRGGSLGELCELPIGERDRHLLCVREALFGPRIEAVVHCPSCGGKLELELDVEDLRVADTPAVDGSITLECDGYALELRLPTALDVQAAGRTGDSVQARSVLVERCILSAAREGQDVCSGSLPGDVQRAAAEALSAMDPQASAHIELVCGVCEHNWGAPCCMDSFLWSELDRWACRLLDEVHALARVYGWTEPEVLTLSPARRKHYIGLAYR